MSTDRRALHRDAFLSALKASPQLMGILNVTPDSFSDGGRHFDPAAAIARARAMVAEGAAIVDIGGESTRPGHLPVSEEEELRRVTPVLEALAGFDAPVSIDTAKAAVAREAARLGACVINDIWGLQRDPGMADAVAETGSAVVVMHNRDEADPAIDILDDVERFFERSLNLRRAAGAPFSRILLDPGVGFGKTPEQNHACIWNLDRFRAPRRADPGRPVAQVVHRPDHRRRGRPSPSRHARRRHDRAHAGGIGAARARRRREPRGARRSSPRSSAPPRLARAASAGTTAGRASSSRLAAMSATRPRACAGRSARSPASRRSNSSPSPASTARPRGARPTRTGSSTPARSRARVSRPRLCSSASRRSRSNSAARRRSAGGRASSTSTSSPTTT